MGGKIDPKDAEEMLTKAVYGKLFKDERDNPSAWSCTVGKFSAHSFSGEVYSRDKKFIDHAASIYGFKYHKFGSTISFRIPVEGVCLSINLLTSRCS
jgi:hypothetical protein